MAITGTKAFTSGEVLTANDVNQYLMRGVKVFSSTAVRDAAYGGAGEPVLEQGEAAFITGTNTLQVYGGTADGWVDYRKAGAGQVLQVVSTTKTNTFSTASATFVDITGLTVTITPSATSSKILLIAQVTGATPDIGFLQFSGGNTASFVGDAAGNRRRAAVSSPDSGGGNSTRSETMVYLDSPSTTSAITYAVQTARRAGAVNTVYINQTSDATDTADFIRSASTITAMEISA